MDNNKEKDRPVQFAKILKNYRKARNINANELAKKLNVAPTTVSMWERGKSYPDVLKLVELCAILSISVDEILFGEENDLLNGLTDMQKFLITQTIKEFRK